MAAVASERPTRSPAQSSRPPSSVRSPQSREWSNWPTAVIMLAVLCLISLLAVSGCKTVSPGDQGTQRSSLGKGHRQEIPGVEPPASTPPPGKGPSPDKSWSGTTAEVKRQKRKQTRKYLEWTRAAASAEENKARRIPGVDGYRHQCGARRGTKPGNTWRGTKADAASASREQDQEIPGVKYIQNNMECATADAAGARRPTKPGDGWSGPRADAGSASGGINQGNTRKEPSATPASSSCTSQAPDTATV